MINIYNPFEKKLTIFVFDNGWKKTKGKIKYEKSEKRYYIVFGKEKIPAPEDYNNYVFLDCLFIVRTKLSGYRLLKPTTLQFQEVTDNQGNKIAVPILGTDVDPSFAAFETREIEPSDIYGAILDAEMRKERMKTTLDKLLPVIMMVIALVGIGIFIAVVWSSVGGNLAEISKNLNEMSLRLENVTIKLNEIIAGKVLPAR